MDKNENDKLKKQYRVDTFVWNSRSIKIGRLIKQGVSISQISRDLGEPLSTVGKIKRAMDLGVELPEGDFAEGEAKVKPKAKDKPKPKDKPGDTTNEKPPRVLEEASEVVAGLSDGLIDGIETPKKIQPLIKKTDIPPLIPPIDLGQKEKTKPILPEDKVWHKSDHEADTEGESVDEPDEDQPVDKKTKTNGNGSKEKIPAGSLFNQKVSVRLTVGNIFWYHYAVQYEGYEGTIEDFANDCIDDCAKARGLSLQVVREPVETENPLGGKNNGRSVS